MCEIYLSMKFDNAVTTCRMRIAGVRAFALLCAEFYYIWMQSGPFMVYNGK